MDSADHLYRRLCATLLCAALTQQAYADGSRWVCQPTTEDDPWHCRATQEAVTEIHQQPDLPFIQWVPSQDDNYLCGGYYQEPQYPYPGNPSLDEDLPITLSADQSTLATSGLSTLIGDVTVQQGNRVIHADQAVIDRDLDSGEIRSISARGNIVLTEPGLQIEGERSETQFGQVRTRINHAAYVLSRQHAHGGADKVSVNERHTVVLTNANYTTCAPNAPDWEVSAKKIRLDQENGRGQAHHARLNIKGQPVFYLPYLDFPLDKRRASGFLYPSFGSTSTSGFALNVPYYWNIAPNYDATITPRILTERGVQAQGLFRYLTKTSNGEVRGAFLPDDRKYRDFRRDKLKTHLQDNITNNDPRVLALSGGGNHRSAFSWFHHSQWNDNWGGSINYSQVGDDNYFIDLSNNIRSSSTGRLEQEAELRYDDSHWHSFFKVQEYQTLHPYSGPTRGEVYRRQPQWFLEGSYPKLWQHLQFDFEGEWTQFSHERDPETRTSFTQGHRVYLNPGLSYPLYRAWGFVRPRVQLNSTFYDLSLGSVDRARHQPSQTKHIVPVLDVDSGLYFDRAVDIFGQSYTQTFEPRVYGLYVPYENQNATPDFDSGVIDFSAAQLFRYNRFSGYDRIGDAKQITLALTTRLRDPVHREKLRATVGEIFYFRDRDVTLCDQNIVNGCRLRENATANDGTSALVTQLKYQFNQEWSADADWEWNHHQNISDKSSFNLNYRGRDNRVFNLGYQYLRRDRARTDVTQDAKDISLQQTDTSFAWPINYQWRALGRWHYDIEENRSLDLLGGLEYNSCCLAVQLVGSRYLRDGDGISDSQYANAVFLRIMFKGLSTVSVNQDARKLSTDIPGFEPFSNRQFTKY